MYNNMYIGENRMYVNLQHAYFQIFLNLLMTTEEAISTYSDAYL